MTDYTHYLWQMTHVAETSAGAPIVVVGTARPELEDRDPDWLAVDGAAEIRLEPRDGEAVDRLVEHLLGGSLPADVLAELVQLAKEHDGSLR